MLELQELKMIDISNNDGNFTGVYLPNGYQLAGANVEVIADKIPTLTNPPICTIQ
jgi:hypothetical protein